MKTNCCINYIFYCRRFIYEASWSSRKLYIWIIKWETIQIYNWTT